MQPVSPIIPGTDLPVTDLAKNQKPYLPLPCHIDSNAIMYSRWHMTFRERVRVFWHGDIYLSVMTFGQSLQPVLVRVRPWELECGHQPSSKFELLRSRFRAFRNKFAGVAQ